MAKQIGVGFVGAGWMGSVQMQRLCERDDVQILSLLEPNKDRGEQVLASLGLDKSILVSDYSEILDNNAVDAVWLVNPNSFHGPQAIAAMRVGKHVFCEKPCATRYEDFLTEIQLETENPALVTLTDYIIYFDQMEHTLRSLVAEDAFGPITQIQVNYRHPVNIAGDKAWKLRQDIMGDAIGMGIVHAISAMVFVMASQAKPAAVYAASMPAKVRGFEADPIWSIMVHFDNGAVGFCHGNIDNGNGYDAFHSIYGTRGAFVFDSQQPRPNKVKYWSQTGTQGKWLFPLDPDREQGLANLAWDPNTATPDSGNVVEHQTGAAVGHFIDCIKSNRKSPLSFSNSSVIAEIGWAAQISAITGRKIELPLDPAESASILKGHLL